MTTSAALEGIEQASPGRMQLFSKGCAAVPSVLQDVTSNPSQGVITGNAHLHMWDHHPFVGKIPECEGSGRGVVRGGKSELFSIQSFPFYIGKCSFV